MAVLSFLQVDIEPGELLFADDFTQPLENNWEITKPEWKTENGILSVICRENAGSLIYSKKQYPGDIMLDFYGTMISPCNHDLNFTFRADGWDYEKNDASIGYVGGLNGWWTSQAGIERYPGCKPRSLSGFKGVPDKEYHIQTGIVDDTVFLAVDGEVQLIMTDSDPITADNCARVGLGTYCSQIRFRDFKLYRLKVTPVEREYTADF